MAGGLLAWSNTSPLPYFSALRTLDHHIVARRPRPVGLLGCGGRGARPPRPAAPGARAAVEPLGHQRGLRGIRGRPLAGPDRAPAGETVPPFRSRPYRSELPPVALRRHGGGA